MVFLAQAQLAQAFSLDSSTPSVPGRCKKAVNPWFRFDTDAIFQVGGI
jgi:hypothetical protein